MLLLLTAVLLTSHSVMAHYLDIYQQEPEDVEFARYTEVHRSASIDLTCPPRVVCGIAFDFNRTINNVDYRERRVIYNCMCPGGTLCPITPEHRLFNSIRKRDYLCEPVRTFIPCSNPRRVQSRLRPRFAEERIIGDMEFNMVPYTRVNCVCPRHFDPVIPQSRWDMQLATLHSKYRYDPMEDINYEYRHCIN